MRSETQTDRFAADREAMVRTQIAARGIADPRLLRAMASVPRHEFVSADAREQAYEDCPLPIGAGQTISQPCIVAVMIQALRLEPDYRALEIGAGSGYLSAVLAELCRDVYSLERLPLLAQKASATLLRLGYKNVRVIEADGTVGWPEESPYDAIVVSAAAPKLPSMLFEQLQEGGRMVIPIGPAESQQLQLVKKQNGHPATSVLEHCRFVPLIGAQGYATGWDN